MHSTRKPAAVLVLFFIYAYATLSPTTVLADCPGTVLDRSYIIERGDLADCGAQAWELVAEFQGQDYDEGATEAQGTCTGNYYNCDCNLTVPGYKIGSIAIVSDILDEGEGEYNASWYWNVKQYTGSPKYTKCVSGNGPCVGTDPNGAGYYSVETDPMVGFQAGYDETDITCDQ
jgi:hypothetical protein